MELTHKYELKSENIKGTKASKQDYKLNSKQNQATKSTTKGTTWN